MASILADRQYTLNQFKQREAEENVSELNDEIISKINKLAKRVGAPSYQKTPVFKRNHYHGKNKKKENISNADWAAIRNFKKTKLEKNVEGLEAQIDKIRSYLNKLTDKNYDEISECIICIIKDIIKEGDDSALEKVGKHIFEIGSLNKFWSILYARLYKDLIINFGIMKEICVKNFDSFEELFNTINYIDPQSDYNKFCEYNKENEKRRALSSFFIICAGYDIIDKNRMETIIINFINKVDVNIKLENQINMIEEIVMNIGVMISKGLTIIQTFKQYDFIKNQIETFSLMNSKHFPSLSQKIVFRFMDMHDEMED